MTVCAHHDPILGSSSSAAMGIFEVGLCYWKPCLIKQNDRLGLLAHMFNPSTQASEAGGFL